jgi:pimeloyl-ACP methyl ester carboxylesterase
MSANIMMIHGMWAGGWVWNNYLQLFSKMDCTCLTPTLRHHQVAPLQPPAELGYVSLLDYVKDLQDEIEKLDQLPILIGHSMGGILAQMLAARGLAKAMVLLSPAPPQGINVISYASLRMFRETLKHWGFWRKPTRPKFQDAAAVLLKRLPQDEQRRTYEQLVHESGRAACEIGFWFLDMHHAKYVDASQITCPVLLIIGSEDRIHPPAVMRKVALRYKPYSTYHEFPDYGHWLIEEPGWQKIAEYIVKWLQEKALIYAD